LSGQELQGDGPGSSDCSAGGMHQSFHGQPGAIEEVHSAEKGAKAQQQPGIENLEPEPPMRK